MNLKISSHYSYFVYPFMVSDGKYNEFIGKLLSDDVIWEFKVKDDNIDLYSNAYFLPYVKKFLFPTLYWNDEYRNSYKNMSCDKKVKIVSELSCAYFSYKIKNENDSYFKLSDTKLNFKISNMNMICFNSGVCFLVIKTKLEKDGEISSNDVLNFNHKFRTINPRYLKKQKYSEMFLLNREFGDVKEFSGCINKLLYGFEDIEKVNIYFDRMFVYSYMCISKDDWNEGTQINQIIDVFYKFKEVLKGDYDLNFDDNYVKLNNNTYSKWKYTIYGFSRDSGVVFASENEYFNAVKLPDYFEGMYFYIFLLAFYQRISLLLFSMELASDKKNKIDKLKLKLTKFTNFSWFSQITNSEQGMDLWKKWQNSFDLHDLFDEVQKEYTEFYDYTVAYTQEKINFLLTVIYTVSLLFSGMLLLVDFHMIDSNNQIARIILMILICISVASYPTYLLIKILNKYVNRHIKKI